MYEFVINGFKLRISTNWLFLETFFRMKSTYTENKVVVFGDVQNIFILAMLSATLHAP